jgi:hypothetical protein
MPGCDIGRLARFSRPVAVNDAPIRLQAGTGVVNAVRDPWCYPQLATAIVPSGVKANWRG